MDRRPIWQFRCKALGACLEVGIADPPDEYTAPGVLLTIGGDAFVVRRASGEVLLRGVFELDASTSPKSITWIDAIGADAGAAARQLRIAGGQLSHRRRRGRERHRWCAPAQG